MNLAFVVPGGVDRSGERRIVPTLLSLLERIARRHRVTVFALRQEPRRASWTIRGAAVENIGRPLTVPRAIGAIRSAHRSARFDAIQSVWGGDGGFISVCAARILGVPSFVHLTGGELIALPEIGYGSRLRWRRRVVDDWYLRRATRVTATSAPMVSAAAALGIDAQRIPLGVDLRDWPARAPRRRETSSAPRLVHVASLNRVKEQRTLLGTFAALTRSHPGITLEIVGEDTLNGAIQAHARELGLADRVTFHGFLTQSALRPILEAAHVHVVSSWHEAGPMVALEAAVAGVPTVGSHVGHLAEWAPRAALTSAPGDASALATQIARLLDDEHLRLSVATEAARIALREDADFTADAFLAQYTAARP